MPRKNSTKTKRSKKDNDENIITDEIEDDIILSTLGKNVSVKIKKRKKSATNEDDDNSSNYIASEEEKEKEEEIVIDTNIEPTKEKKSTFSDNDILNEIRKKMTKSVDPPDSNTSPKPPKKKSSKTSMKKILSSKIDIAEIVKSKPEASAMSLSRRNKESYKRMRAHQLKESYLTIEKLLRVSIRNNLGDEADDIIALQQLEYDNGKLSLDHKSSIEFVEDIRRNCIFIEEILENMLNEIRQSSTGLTKDVPPLDFETKNLPIISYIPNTGNTLLDISKYYHFKQKTFLEALGMNDGTFIYKMRSAKNAPERWPRNQLIKLYDTLEHFKLLLSEVKERTTDLPGKKLEIYRLQGEIELIKRSIRDIIDRPCIIDVSISKKVGRPPRESSIDDLD